MTEQTGSGKPPETPPRVLEPTPQSLAPEVPPVNAPAEPPQVSPPVELPPLAPPEEPTQATAPEAAAPVTPPEAAPNYTPPVDPTTTPAPSQFEPGRGAPLVTGPPSSVNAPIDANKVNIVFGIAGVLMIVAVLIVVIIVGLILISALRPR
jgi:hypothetical protein